jgi:hypothetical protein
MKLEGLILPFSMISCQLLALPRGVNFTCDSSDGSFGSGYGELGMARTIGKLGFDPPRIHPCPQGVGAHPHSFPLRTGDSLPVGMGVMAVGREAVCSLPCYPRSLWHSA